MFFWAGHSVNCQGLFMWTDLCCRYTETGKVQVCYTYSFLSEYMLTQHGLDVEANARKVSEDKKKEQEKDNERLLQEEKEKKGKKVEHNRQQEYAR
jgi:hypothetical protein